MAKYSADSLHIKSQDKGKAGAFASVDSKTAGWDYLNMAAVRLTKGKTFEIQIDDYEYLAVVLSGTCNIKTNKGDFKNVGRRDTVFTGMPYAVYLPRHTEFEIESMSDNFEVASCWVPSDQDGEAKLITPKDVELSLLGGDNASRQMSRIIGSDFPAQRILCYELYTPGGNWSSYPPHKHDTHKTDDKGKVLEAKLNRLSFFKFDRPTGYAYQRVYNEDKSTDALMTTHNHDLVLMPEGYYTLVSAPGTTTYTLNFLAGSTREFAYTEDPDYAWYKETFTGKDSRLPIVDHGMEVGY